MEQTSSSDAFAVVTSFFDVPKESIDTDVRITQFEPRWEDWGDLLNTLEDTLRIDIDFEEWEELGGFPQPGRNISETLTLGELLEFIDKQEVETLERATQTVLRLVVSPEVDLLPRDFALTLTDEQRTGIGKRLRLVAERFCLSWNQPLWERVAMGVPTQHAIKEVANKEAENSASDLRVMRVDDVICLMEALTPR